MGRVVKYIIVACALLCGFAERMSAQRLAPVYDTIPMMQHESFDRPLAFLGKPADNFSIWCSINIDYPEEALRQNITGKVMVRFIITAEGQVTDVKVIRGAHPLLDAEAVRVVSSSPDWEPVTVNGKKVNVEFAIPIAFRITKKRDNDRTIEHARFAYRGHTDFISWISQNIRCPKEAVLYGVEGNVYLAFDISPEGYVENVKVLRGAEVEYYTKKKRTAALALNDEAVRVVSASPRWIPAMIGGEPVKVSYNVRISFSKN